MNQNKKTIEEVGYKVIKSSDGISEGILRLKVIGMDNPHCVGIIFTTFTEESCLLNIICDALGNSKIYKNKSLRIESQRDFLVYQPGDAQISYSSG